MPFMRGPMPLRRTTYYLEQGQLHLRDSVRIFSINFHAKPKPLQQGARYIFPFTTLPSTPNFFTNEERTVESIVTP